MPWVKGQSGNPGGKPKSHAEFRKLLTDLMPAAAKRLGELIKSADEKVAIEAAKLISAYSVGKPPEPSDVAHMDAMDARRVLVSAVRPAELPAPMPLAAPPDVVDVEPKREGLRCLYRGPDGQCGDLAATGAQWCDSHKAKLFATLG